MRPLAIILACVLVSGCFGPGPGPGQTDEGEASGESVDWPGMVIATNKGNITAVLYPEAAPLTVALYRAYIAEDYFVGRSLDRIWPEFIVQLWECDDANPEDGRRVPYEVTEEHRSAAGALSVARGQDPRGGGPSFYLHDFPNDHLTGHDTVFGQIVDGMDIIREAARAEARINSPPIWLDPVPNPFPGPDRCAVDPLEIVSVAEAIVTLSATESARYPIQTVPAQSIAEGYEAQIEWGNNLAANQETQFTTYLGAIAEPTGDTPRPNQLTMRVEGIESVVPVDPRWNGVYDWTWTPSVAGEHAIDVLIEDVMVASWTIVVAPE